MKALLSVLLLFASTFLINAQLVHPGISHTKSDLDRMKYMVEAEIEPWISTFNALQSTGAASYNYTVNGDPSITTITSHAPFFNDGFAAYSNALMWYITGDERHAQKCVEIFNAWSNITRIEDQFALNNGRGPWKMCEAAEIIKHTYSGWSTADQQRFGNMLVYPGWSGTAAPTSAIASKDVSFYWNIYQGDRLRHGNQGLFAMRSMMAIGIFLDNEVIYERALRYLQGLPHRSDDLAYPSGPPQTTAISTGCEYYDEFRVDGHGNIEDYGYNEVLANYIWESGQSQESSRDQAHALGGVSIISCIAEMAWSQGDNLYGHLDNRLLLGWEYYYRYNLSYVNSYPDQTSPWEPTVASGEFIERIDRSGRWRSLQMNPYLACNIGDDYWHRGRIDLMVAPVFEQSLGHYKDRLLLNANEYKWLERGYEHMKANIGFEDGRNAVDHAGWGGLKFHRVSPGDPISGFDNNGLPVYAMNVLPMIIEVENYDYFAINGQGRTYNDSNSNNNVGGAYRPNEGVDIEECSEGGYNIGWITDGEFLTYTVAVPENDNFSIAIRYAADNSNGTVSVLFDDDNVTGFVSLPSTGGVQVWDTLELSANVNLTQGVKSMKILVGNGGFNINNIIIFDSDGNTNASSSFTPDPNKTYYIDNLYNNARLASDGSSEAPYTTSLTTTGADVEWQFVAKGNGYWHIQRAAGGTNPRLRTDNSSSADMQPIAWDGVYTYYNFTTGAVNNTHFITLPDGPDNYKRLQVAPGGSVNMVTDSHDGTWESFRITEASSASSIVHITKRNASDFAIDGNSGGENGQNVYLWSESQNNVNQRWIEIDRGDGYYSYQKEGTNYCIDGNGGGADGQNVYLWQCAENNQNQHWRKVSTEGGTFRLEKRNASNYSLDGGNGGANSQNVYLWTSNDNNQNQQWFITPVGTAAKSVDNASLANNVLIYPNPVSSIATVSGAANSTIRIYNINGQELLSIEILRDNESLDLSSLSTGIYYAQVKGDQGISITKIIKE